MATIAVKMSIMRVVKFMSSWDNDFMSWPKHCQLFFGGQSVELPLSLNWFPWLLPGGYQWLSMWEIWSKNSQSFDVWRTLTATGVKGYRNRVTCISQSHETPGSSDAMHTPDVTQQILSEITNQNLKNVKFWCMDQGALYPVTSINPYLGGNAWKKWATFYMSVHLCILWKPQFRAKCGTRGPPRAIYEPREHRDTYCIKRVKHTVFLLQLFVVGAVLLHPMMNH